MTCPARRIARASAAAGAPTFRFYFAHTASYGATVALGAYHSAELPYVFGTFAAEGYLPTLWEQTLSDEIQDRWGRHAVTGSPNGADLGAWPAFSSTDERWLNMDLSTDAEPDSRAAQCDLWGKIIGW
jgi:para-nitrobenzyl esterase